MSHETIPTNRRVYLTFASASEGRVRLRMSYAPPEIGTAMVALISRGLLMDATELTVDLISEPMDDPAVAALQSAKLLGLVTLQQTATVAIAAGMRTIGLTVPVSMGLKAGDTILAVPTVRVAGYAVHDAVAVSATLVSIALTAPLLAIGQSYQLACKLIRLNV